MVYVLKDFPILRAAHLHHMPDVFHRIDIAEHARLSGSKYPNYLHPVTLGFGADPLRDPAPMVGTACGWWFDYHSQCVRCTITIDRIDPAAVLYASPVAARGEFRSIALLEEEPYPGAPRIDNYQPKEPAVPVQPLEDRVLIKLDPQPTVSAGGIALPSTQEKDQTTGEVLAVGPGRRNDRGDLVPMTVQVGQRVLFSKYGGLRVEQAGEDVVVMREHELFAVLTK